MYKIKGEDTVSLDISDDSYIRALQIKTLKRGKRPILKNYCEKLKDTKEECKRISSNIPSLDDVLEGGMASGVYIFGANPGLGKTSLMVHLIINLALQKQHTILFNLEMSSLQITSKLLSNYSYRLELENLITKKMTINDLCSHKVCNNNSNFNSICSAFNNNIEKYINVITKSEDYILPDMQYVCSNYVERIEVALKNYKTLGTTPVVVVDFLQLLNVIPETEDTKEIDRRLEMNMIVDKLKDYSNKYNAPILLISSLSRNYYTKDILNTEEISYNLSAFKESGMIEYQADFLAILSKGEKIVDFGGEDQTTINVSILKNRFGPKVEETFSLIFEPSYSYFKEIEERK